MYSHTPPAPPPKPPGTHDVSRMSTPAGGPAPPPPPPLPEAITAGLIAAATPAGAEYYDPHAQPQETADPGDQWLPKFLEDKSKADLATILTTPPTLTALTHAPTTAHPSTLHSHAHLTSTLTHNMALAQHLLDAEHRLAHQRDAAQAQLLATHALERQWKGRQGDMDEVLAPFAPARLYQRLAGGVVEQEGVCGALEESFLEGGQGGRGGDGMGGGGGGGGGEGGLASEREVAEWVRRYREARRLYYLRWERRERWDEGRVGGWR